MAMSGGRDDGEPMMEMNTTPLIDVMLVLLIMFIITLPIPTHAVKVDLPVNDPRQQKPPVDPQKNKITIDAAGTVSWNGTPVDLVTLRQYLDVAANINPEPELHFQPDPTAKYEKVDETLAVIKRSNVTKLGFIGNEQYRNDF
ncbi:MULTISPECIES: ExbD/TolR family protein [Sphingomonas]|jgi:biopolymer transport protein ExbD|uniref:ExbD/TolR family protein n=1 Tax=Sphingomonas TaxID=13687 RepID=UPI00193B2F03|nr:MULTISPECIES: biopolymer transporter ExbD [Sphingomonas]